MNLRQFAEKNTPTISADLLARARELVKSYDQFLRHWGEYGLKPLKFTSFGSINADPLGYSEMNIEDLGLTGHFFESYCSELKALVERGSEILRRLAPTVDPNVYSLESVFGY